MWPLCFNNQDQTQEEKRAQPEKRQARAHAHLIIVAVSHALRSQDNPRGPRKSSYPSGGKTSKGQCYKCKSTGYWAPDYQKEPPRPCLACKQTSQWKRDCPQSWRGRGGLLFPRWPSCWMTGGQGILVAPRNKMPISIEALQVVLDMAGQKNQFLNWYKSHLFSLNLSCGTSLLQKLYCDWCQWKSQVHCFPGPFTGQFERQLISHAFPIVPQYLTSVPGRGLLSSLGAILQLGGPREPCILTLRQTSQKSKILCLAIFYKQ